MIPDGLERLDDNDLRAVIGRAEELLAQHDRERKADAMAKAKTLLESVGLRLEDLARAKTKASKGPIYRGGHTYQHPADKTLVWSAKGKKPAWLVSLEADGGKAVEVNLPSHTKG